MYCTTCGNEIDDNAVICVHCGVPVQRMVNPYYVPHNAMQPIQPKAVNGFGIAGFVISLLSIGLGAFFSIPALLGLIFSIIGMARIKKCNSVNGLAIAGLIISIFTTLFWVTVWIIYAVAGSTVPGVY